MSTPKYMMVTGANKGIGLAIARGLLDAGCYVFLGARDLSRGEAAVRELVDGRPQFASNVQLVQLEVTSQPSVDAAAEAVRARCGSGGLQGLINNAGGAEALFFSGIEDAQYALELNMFSVERVTRTFLPLLAPVGGRIVMMSSKGGPDFLSGCSAERKHLLSNPDVSCESISALVGEYIDVAARASGTDDPGAVFGAAGFGSGAPYGCSKACLNAYAMVLARQNPGMCVNACTPGLVQTDLSRKMIEKSGWSTPPTIKTPEQGAAVPLHLALGEVPPTPGRSIYFGEDGQPAPLDGSSL